MNDSLAYIDDYFNGRLSEGEKEAFENQCESDPAFAREVAFYVSARDSFRQLVQEEKKKEFAALYTELSTHRPKPVYRILTRMIPYAAAACLMIVLGWALFFQPPSAEKMASRYMATEMQTMDIPMSGGKDSLQMGIEAYNRKNYEEAEQIFQHLVPQPVVGSEAMKNLGIVYLVTERYDEAMVQFDALARQTHLYENPGLFYKALTLMKRSAGGDKKQAKEILEEVIRRNLSHKEEAEKWVKQL